MGKKNKGPAPRVGKLVFSTGSEGNSFFNEINIEPVSIKDLASHKLELRVYRDKKNRRGKVATVVTGYRGNLQFLKNLGKELKKECGVGGTVKNNEIIIQGDFKDKIIASLIAKGYTRTKGTGG